MTTITQNVTDIAGADDNTSWTFYTEAIRQSGTGDAIVSTKKVRKTPVAGVLTVELDPGPAVVVFAGRDHYAFTVPEDDSELWPLIQAAVAVPRDTSAQRLAAAVDAYLTANPPEGGGSGGDVVDDTTPQLGGNLDPNGHTVGDATAADLTKLHALTPTATELNFVDGVTSSIQTQLDAKTTSAAVATQITTAVNALLNGAPGALDTLKELADAINDDDSFAATVTAALAGKQPSDADLTAIAALTSAANKVPYATGAGAWALADFTAAGRALVDDADAKAQRITLSAERAFLHNVKDYGALGDGTTDDNTALQAAIAASLTSGMPVYFPPGIYKHSGTLNFVEGQSMLGAGSRVVILKYSGSTLAMKVNLSTGTTFTGGHFAGTFQGFTLDGTLSTSTANGLQFGNLQGMVCHDVAINAFPGINWYGKNGTGQWHEQGRFTSCTSTLGVKAVVFDTGSFDYARYDFTIIAGAGQGGVILQNDANLFDCSLDIRGNFYAKTGSNTSAVLAIDPGNTSGTSYIKNTIVNIGVEANGTGIGHYTILLGSSNSASQFYGMGQMTFAQSGTGQAFQGFSTAGAIFGFSGNIDDPVLGQLKAGDGFTNQGGSQWSAFGNLSSNYAYDGMYIYPQFGDFQAFILPNGAITVAGFDDEASLKRTRRLELLFKQPTGTPCTITWPANVKWRGGISALSATNSAIDRVRLTYFPSELTWYAELIPGTSGADYYTNGTGNTLTAGTVELGAASDTTLSRSAAGVLAVEGVVVPTISSTSVLTNKAVTPRTFTTASSASFTFNASNDDFDTITALAANLTINNHSGTPVSGQRYTLRIKDNGTSRTISFGTAWRAIGVTLPTATTVNKTMYIFAIWNSTDSKWDVVDVKTEA